jgi:hypothetical protein
MCLSVAIFLRGTLFLSLRRSIFLLQQLSILAIKLLDEFPLAIYAMQFLVPLMLIVTQILLQFICLVHQQALLFHIYISPSRLVFSLEAFNKLLDFILLI